MILGRFVCGAVSTLLFNRRAGLGATENRKF